MERLPPSSPEDILAFRNDAADPSEIKVISPSTLEVMGYRAVRVLSMEDPEEIAYPTSFLKTMVINLRTGSITVYWYGPDEESYHTPYKNPDTMIELVAPNHSYLLTPYRVSSSGLLKYRSDIIFQTNRV